MTETAAPLRESRSLIALLKWVKRGRAARKPHPLRWRAFFQLEDSEVFKKGTLTKAVFAFAFVLFFGFLYRFIDSLDFGGNEGVRVFSNGILPLSGLIALLSALGYASNALRREKDRDCGVFLLTSPVEERSILFGKWLYYQSFALRILALGTIVSMVWRAFAFRDWQGLYSQENSPLGVWMTLPVMVAWIPLLSLFGIQQGLHSRFQSGAIRLLVPILILWLGGGILSLFFATLESSVRWSGVWRFFAWFLTEALSPALLFVAAVSAMAVKRLSPSPDSLHIVWRVALGSAWLSLALLDIFLGRLGWFQFFLFGERITFEEFRVYLRLMVLPLCASWLGWVYLATRSRLWWRKRLTSLESAA